ncbi:MAG: hypothetical protein H7039_12375 [Bryobacteraceae bacterium]|nr:hypothetical protein [Bryobacteraceae bacterium]
MERFALTQEWVSEEVCMMPKHTFTSALPSAALVAVLGSIHEKRQFQAKLIHCAGRMMKLQVPEDVPAGMPLRIDVDGGLVLGEVSSSVTLGAEVFLLVEIDQVIPSVTDLANLVSAVLGQRPVSQEIAAGPMAFAAMGDAQTVPVTGVGSR